MRIAYIITAYQDPPQLRRLIESLDEGADFFVHVDSRVDIRAFQTGLAARRNVRFTENRFFVNWGSFAQVLSQKELLRCVMATGVAYDRVVCLSGADYPIWSNRAIADEFLKHPAREWIAGFNVTRCAEADHHERVAQHHFLREIRLPNRTLKRWATGSARLAVRGLCALTGFKRSEQVPLAGRMVDIYTGSDYWALTFDCARFVYDRMCNEPGLMQYFKYSYVPSEMCVQTIVFNSRFAPAAQLCEGSYRGLASLTPLHHLEYTDAIRVFEEDDFEGLLASGKIFFRKAQSGRSDGLLAKVDAYRRNDRVNIG